VGRRCSISRTQFRNFYISSVIVSSKTKGDKINTCSGEVLMNTGGPFRQFMKMGTSLFKKAGYMAPVT